MGLPLIVQPERVGRLVIVFAPSCPLTPASVPRLVPLEADPICRVPCFCFLIGFSQWKAPAGQRGWGGRKVRWGSLPFRSLPMFLFYWQSFSHSSLPGSASCSLLLRFTDLSTITQFEGTSLLVRTLTGTGRCPP